MQRTRAGIVVSAATRLKVLAERARRRVADAEQEAALLASEANGFNDAEEELPPTDGGVARGTPQSSVAPSRRTSQINVPDERKRIFAHDLLAIKEIVFSGWMNVMLVCAPLGWMSAARGWGAVPTFLLNFLALVPLALILGDVTEDLALRFGDVVGGLMNATFGNVVEIILSITALQKRLYTVVAMSLLGSILSNLLLVLGSCFFFGGIRYRQQAFNATANKACNSLLFLSCIGIIVPTAAQKLRFGEADPELSDAYILGISRGAALVLISVYLAYMIFQLYTHHDLFTGGQDEEEQPIMSIPCAVLLLTIITFLVGISSELLTDVIEDVSHVTGLSELFLGVVILPIAGNACEHLTAVIVAMKGKMDLALGVAVGSSIQISLFAIPLVVLVGWATGQNFSLNFDPFAVLCLTVAVIHANFVTADATSHWLLGLQLIATYILMAVAFAFE